MENDCKGSEGETELEVEGVVLCTSSGISRESPMVRFGGLTGGKEAEVGEKASLADRLVHDREGVAYSVRYWTGCGAYFGGEEYG